MEFHEKLQELRKKQGLTQEELAKELFVSRTAISKWELGKGYPSIDSLKEISRFFSVTIDDLLSSEELITAASSENRSNHENLTDMLVGIVDVMNIMSVLLPLFPKKMNGSIAAVELLAYTRSSMLSGCICWCIFAAIIIAGIVKVILNHMKIKSGRRIITAVSFILSIICVLFLTMIKAPYAVTVTFFLLVIKGAILLISPAGER